MSKISLKRIYLKRLRHAILVFFSILATSCVNYTSDRIPPSRINYNEAMQYGDKQQLLLNIVRLRYYDPTYFFSVNNLIAQINYSNTFTGGTNNTWTPPPVNFSTSGTDSVTVGEAPTITYTPLQGDAFIKKMLTPIDLRILFVMLRNSDVDIGRVLRVFAMALGPFNNESVHRGDEAVVPDLRFREMAELLSRLVDSMQLNLDSALLKEQFAIKMTLKGFEKLSPKEQKILKKLGFSRTNTEVWLVQAKRGGISLQPQTKNPNTISAAAANVGQQKQQQMQENIKAQHEVTYSYFADSSKIVPIPDKFMQRRVVRSKPKKILILQTRTLFMVLSYLSKGVHVPPEEVNQKITSGSRLPNGKLLNWQFFTSGIFEVHICKTRPNDAFLYVRYRDRWYYIRDDDITAKGMFYMVMMMMNLYEGNVQSGLTPFYSIVT